MLLSIIMKPSQSHRSVLIWRGALAVSTRSLRRDIVIATCRLSAYAYRLTPTDDTT